MDKLAISFPVEGFLEDGDTWSRTKRQQRGGTSWSSARSTDLCLGPHATLYVEVFWVPSRTRYYGKLEVNPSRIVDPCGYGLCAVADLPYAVGLAWDAASAVITPACPLWDARIRRMDLARDGTCSDPAMYILGILKVPAPYARHRAMWVNPATCQPGTLVVGGSTTGHVRFYAKHMNAPGKATPGEWRFEVQAHDGWLEKPGNMTKLTDVSTDTAYSLLGDRWEWMGMGTVIKLKDQWVHDLLDTDIITALDPTGAPRVMSYATKERLIGYADVLASGRVPKEPSPTRMAEYRRAVRQIGIFLSPDEIEVGLGQARSLSFEKGTEVRSAA